MKTKINAKIKPKRILMTSFGGIGNTLLFLPTIKAVKDNFPKSEIYFITSKKPILNLLKESQYKHNYIDKFLYYRFNRKQGFFKKAFNFAKFLRKHNFDIVIVCGEEGLFSALSYFLAGIKYRVAHKYNFRPFGEIGFLYTHAIKRNLNKHEVEHNLDLARISGLKIKDKKIELNPVKKWHCKKTGRTIGFHLGSVKGVEEKRWPFERFVELIKKIKKDVKHNIVVIGGSEEKDIKYKLEKLHLNIINLIGKTSIKETAAIIKQCDLFISNDSGPMHVAAAVGTPVIGIFGPTSTIKNRPWGDPKKCLFLQKKLPCYGSCFTPYIGKINCTNVIKKECLKKITIDEVYDLAKRFLK